MPPLPQQQQPPAIVQAKPSQEGLGPLIAPQLPVPPPPQFPTQPEYRPSISGSYGQQVLPEQAQRIQNFLGSYSVPKRLDSVVVVPKEKWDDILKSYAPSGQGGFMLRGSRPYIPQNKGALTLLAANRAYINGGLFDKKGPEDGVEWLLAHELAHINDPRPPQEQERFDNEIDKTAREGLRKWIIAQQAMKRQNGAR